MTYVSTAARRYRRPNPRRGLSGFLDDLLGGSTTFGHGADSDEVQCVNRANAAIAPLDAKIDDLQRTWAPTGFFTSQEIRDLVSATMKVVTQAQASVDAAAAEPNAMQDRVMSATNDLARAGGRSLDYLDAARTADEHGLRLVNAAGLKRWVTDTLATASAAMVTASVIGCLRPWWVGALAAYQSVFDVAWAVAKRTLGAVLAIGETALEVVSELPQLVDVLKWGALAVGGYWLWTQLNLKRSGS